jgi:hypothetical protein
LVLIFPAWYHPIPPQPLTYCLSLPLRVSFLRNAPRHYAKNVNRILHEPADLSFDGGDNTYDDRRVPGAPEGAGMDCCFAQKEHARISAEQMLFP